MSVLCFNFYTDHVLFCDKLHDTDKLVPEEGLLFKRKACYNPSFVTQLSNVLITNHPNLVAITTQGDVKDSYLHTDFLPRYMRHRAYDLLTTKYYARTKDDGINMSIYTRYGVKGYGVEDMFTDTTGDTDTLNINVITPEGLIAFIGLNRPESSNLIDPKLFDQFIDNVLMTYKNEAVNYYMIMGHSPGVIGKDCKSNVIQTYDNFIESGMLSGNAYELELKQCNPVYSNSAHMGHMNLYIFTIKNPKVLCFSWNTDRIPLCDQPYDDMDIHERRKWFSTKTCYNPTFFNQIRDEIVKHDPDIVTIVNEGDLPEGTFFHYQFLRSQMPNYYLLDNSKASNIGQNLDSMRMSIYVRKDLDLSLVHLNRGYFSSQEEFSCKNRSVAKAMVKYVETGIGVMAFTAIQMPHEYNKVEVNQCLANIQQKLLSSKKISYIFLLGDFNLQNMPNYQDWKLKLPSLADYQNGKYIHPNYQLKPISNKDRGYFRMNSALYKNYKTWHDNIYYKTQDMAMRDIHCVDYKTIMGFPMLQDPSEHLGVIGIYEFTPISFKDELRQNGENTVFDDISYDDINELSDYEPFNDGLEEI